MSAFINHCAYCDKPFQAERSTSRYCSNAHGSAYRRRATIAWREDAFALLREQQRAAVDVDAVALGAVIRRAERLFDPARRRTAI